MKKPDDKARVWLKLNRRGEVKVVFHSVSTPALRTCLDLLAQLTRSFSKDADVAEVTFDVPEPKVPAGTISCPLMPREAKESGDVCKTHRDCGAGQICIGAAAVDGGTPGRSRCLDLQRWLVAQSS